MPTLTDVVILCFLLFFLLDGWRKGFLSSAIGPITFFFCSVLGLIYFDLTQNFLKAFFYTILGTTAATVLIIILLAAGRSSVDPNYRDYNPLLSRFAGSFINLFWQGAILLIIMFLIAVAPFQVLGLGKVQANIQQSFSYSFLVNQGLRKIPALQKIMVSFAIFQSPDQLQRLSSTEEFRHFFLNKKVQALLQDEVFMKNVENKNVAEILAHPKMMDIFEDDYLMETLTKLAKKVYSLNLPETNTETP